MMENGNILLGLSYTFCGLMVIAISIPLLLEQIGINRWYGIRFKKSYESEENWYAINKFGAKRLIIWSIPVVFLGIAAFFIPIEGNGALAKLYIITPMLLIIPALESYLYARKL